MCCGMRLTGTLNLPKEIWGHSTDDRKAVQDDRKIQIKQIYEAAQQIYNKNWWAPPYTSPNPPPPWWWWRDLWIRVQCSPGGDDDKKCGDDKKPPPKCPGNDQPPDNGKTSEVEAYSNPLERYSKITFCNRFFNEMTSLSFVINTAKKNPGRYANDLWNYQNRARVVFHEITHLNYFMNAPDKSPYVDDVRISYKVNNKETTEPSYGPENIKMLANYEAVGKGGFFTQRNADSFAWFAVAKYIESQVGRYPTNPVMSRIPVRAPRDGKGRLFATSSDTEDGNNADVNGTSGTSDPGDNVNATDPAVNATMADHWIPGCPDHPILDVDTFGVSSVIGFNGSNSNANTTCDTNALSGIPYNVFYDDGNDSVYDNFCFNIDGTVNLQWTVDVHGNQTQQSSKNKRTPPPNPNAYGSYKFELSWEVTGNEGCGQNPESCGDAFAMLANSPCGHQGGEQNGMTASGKIDLPGCGTYSYNITGPSVPAPVSPPTSSTIPAPPAPSLGSQWCYDSAAFGSHDDISGDFQGSSATYACKDADGHMIQNGDNSTNIHYTPDNYMGNVPYVYDVYWEPGCQSSVTQMDAGNLLPGQQDVTCSSLLTSDYKNCNNGGIGGKMSVGCLTYRFKASETQG